MVMQPDHYRAEAERLAQLAAQTYDPDQRAAFRGLALSYRTRAKSVEKRLQRKPAR